jgi:hypothetical protein
MQSNKERFLRVVNLNSNEVKSDALLKAVLVLEMIPNKAFSRRSFFKISNP